jgi:predicted dehydrogenase
MEALRVAVVGAGAISRAHLEAVSACPSLEVAGVFDRDNARARAAAERYGGLCYASWEDLLADSAVECVAVLVPPDGHEPLAVQALKAGKHVVCEKPMGRSVEECDRMIAVAAAAKRWLLPGHNRVFTSAIEHIRQAIDRGEIGEVFLAQSEGLERPVLLDQVPWLRGELSQGGVLVAQAVHPAYVLRWLLGPVTAVQALSGGRRVVEMTYEDTAVVNLRFLSGAVATMTSTFAVTHGPFDHSVTVYGTQGYLRSSRNGGLVERLRGVLPQRFGDDEQRDIDLGTPQPQTAFRRMWEEYARAIREGTPPRMTAGDGRAAVRVIRAAYESIERGVTVTLADPA